MAVHGRALPQGVVACPTARIYGLEGQNAGHSCVVQFILNVPYDYIPVTDRHDFIERMGLTAENDGLSRIAGRLFGALLLADEPRSLDELAEQLDVSKASVSTEARRLLERGVAERIGKMGDRRDYYALTPDFFGQIVRFRLNRWSALHRLIRDMEADAGSEPRVVRERFAYIEDVHAFVLSRVEDALAEWSERARASGGGKDRARGTRPKHARKPGTSRNVARERLG
jgi:predicted transcriptional regulator